ncbi:MAG: HEAT repeat domain-containing protein [Polyangiaceae bacterium]|nr:HEAT repeat domain-containing protein [Polyangiaceae bacterium]
MKQTPPGDDEGNFRKGRIAPIAIVLGVLAAVGIGAAFLFAGTKSAEQLSAKQIADERKNVAVLPIDEALPRWRAWAKNGEVPKLQEEAFAQLAWAKDPQGLPLIIKGLESNDHRVRATAATALLEYGSPAADGAKPALLRALKESTDGDRPQIAWALAALHETSAFDDVMASYRVGHLAKVQYLDGRPAFDPEVLAAMVPIDKLASLAGDQSESVRQLVAVALSQNADPKFTGTLIKLVEDKSVEVAREAAVGLGRVGSEQAMQPLLSALERADKDSRQKFLEALRDGVGGRGLVLALRGVNKSNRDVEKYRTKQIFEMLRALEDPRAGDLLVEYINTAQNPHWKTEAALRLAEIGDLRALPTLGWRMKQDPLTLYNKDLDPEYRMDDGERVVSARMLADLAVLYPDKRADIRAAAYDGVYSWLTEKPQPHANGLRFIAASDAKEALPKMRAWANPSLPLPKEGQQVSPDPAWGTAQSALRYGGWMQDAQIWPILDRQLRRRPDNVDASLESLFQGGIAVLGMTLRALGSGAADGFAQWGDPKAYPLLVKHIEDRRNNEQSRMQACFSLGWVATSIQMKEVVKKVHDLDKADPKTQFTRSCYLESLIRHPVPEATAGLVDLLDDRLDLEVRHQAARAIGFGGVTKQIQSQLFERLSDPSVRNDIALALLLGGDEDTVRRMMGSFNNVDPAGLEELKVIYNQTFGYWSDRNYENGDVARWIRNANVASRASVREVLQDWPRLILARAMQGIDYDNGPHSVTRVQMRVRLLRDAHGADAQRRDDAIAILKFMGEKGVLMALKSEPGHVQEQAQRALFELMNPKSSTEALPEATDAKTKGTAH